MPVFHPDLASARFIPKLSFSPLVLRLTGDRRPKVGPLPDDVVSEDVTVPGENPVQLRVYRPVSLKPGSPALFWIHGGGFIGGSLEQDQLANIEFVRRLGITVVALRYRFAPKHPSPAAIEDAYAGLTWLFAAAAERGIDAARIAIGGASAGAGLAAALALYSLDRGEVKPVFQLLVYPMLDDRTATRTDHDTRNARIWTAKSNHFAWTSYLGAAPGGADVSPYAAPARRDDLAGLPPAWIGVGTLDVFFDEDVEYARRLVDAGVACELDIVPGAFHGFDALYSKKDVSQRFFDEKAAALRGAFEPGGV